MPTSIACPDDNNPSLISTINKDLQSFLNDVGLEENLFLSNRSVGNSIKLLVPI